MGLKRRQQELKNEDHADDAEPEDEEQEEGSGARRAQD